MAPLWSACHWQSSRPMATTSAMICVTVSERKTDTFNIRFKKPTDRNGPQRTATETDYDYNYSLIFISYNYLPFVQATSANWSTNRRPLRSNVVTVTQFHLLMIHRWWEPIAQQICIRYGLMLLIIHLLKAVRRRVHSLWSTVVAHHHSYARQHE